MDGPAADAKSPLLRQGGTDGLGLEYGSWRIGGEGGPRDRIKDNCLAAKKREKERGRAQGVSRGQTVTNRLNDIGPQP